MFGFRPLPKPYDLPVGELLVWGLPQKDDLGIFVPFDPIPGQTEQDPMGYNIRVRDAYYVLLEDGHYNGPLSFPLRPCAAIQDQLRAAYQESAPVRRLIVHTIA